MASRSWILCCSSCSVRLLTCSDNLRLLMVSSVTSLEEVVLVWWVYFSLSLASESCWDKIWVSALRAWFSDFSWDTI